MSSSTPVSPTLVSNLEVTEVADGLVVFDPATDRVHYLNASAAVVFASCDGSTPVEDIAAVVAETFGTTVDAAAAVDQALAEFGREHLLS